MSGDRYAATLLDIGEHRIIDIIRRKASSKGVDNPGLFPGDDACVLEHGEDLLVLTTDCIYGETHIPKGTSPQAAGWYLAAVNLSDLAAMAAKPIGLLLDISAPGSTDIQWLEGFVEGFVDCLGTNHAVLLGGDTKEGPGVYAATAVGICAHGICTPRSGARPGDVIAVTGIVGRTGAMLEKGKGEQVLRIEPRIKEALAAAAAGTNACIDTSDGLSLALHNMSEASDVEIQVDEHIVPFYKGVEAEKAWNTGGDFELLLSMPANRVAEAKKAVEELGTSFTTIGIVSEGKGVKVKKDQCITPLEKLGYQHFTGGPGE